MNNLRHFEMHNIWHLQQRVEFGIISVIYKYTDTEYRHTHTQSWVTIMRNIQF